MSDSTKTLKKIKEVISVERLVLNKNILDSLRLTAIPPARRLHSKLFAYRILYRSGGKQIVGYIVEPRHGKRLPAIIFNRGGSSDFGAITLKQLFAPTSLIVQLASQGYVIIATQYPGVEGGEGIDQFGGEDDIASILDLYKILKKYPRVNSAQVGMYGFSRGGMMTYLCLARARWIKAAVIGAAPADEVSAPKFRKGWADHQKKMYGGSRADQKKRSVLYWVDKISEKVPILLAHGSADWRVNPLDTLRVAQEFYTRKIPFRLLFFEGADHGLTEVRSEFDVQVITWFDHYLKSGKKLPITRPYGL